MTGTAVEYKSF